MKTILIQLIKVYQKVFSPDQGFFRYLYPKNTQHCVMYPSCSAYMFSSVQKYGAFRGFIKGIRRIFRCHPYQKNLIDLP